MNAQVIVKYPVKSLDKVFTYKVPDRFVNTIKVGMKVVVPFNNDVITGIIIKLDSEKKDFEMKEIYNIDESFVINNEQMHLAYYLKKTTLCPLISAFEVCLPPSLKIKHEIKDFHKYETYICLNVTLNDASKYIINNSKAHAQISIIDSLIAKGKIKKSELSASSLKVLLQKGIVKETKEIKNRINVSDNLENKIVLNEEQTNDYEVIA